MIRLRIVITFRFMHCLLNWLQLFYHLYTMEFNLVMLSKLPLHHNIFLHASSNDVKTNEGTWLQKVAFKFMCKFYVIRISQYCQSKVLKFYQKTKLSESSGLFSLLAKCWFRHDILKSTFDIKCFIKYHATHSFVASILFVLMN